MAISDLGQTHKRGTASGYTSKLLKTGQTTQYNDEPDDGYYEKGVAKSYTVNTTGDQSGTTNVDLAHYISVAGAISFNNTTKKITDSGSGLAIFKTNDVILTSSANNPGPFTVTTGNVAGEIICSGATFVDETPEEAITIYKRQAISNNTVLDNNTGLEWTRYQETKFGAVSNGLLPWTGKLYDIFAYCAAANSVLLGGHNDWRIPNFPELYSLANPARPDLTAFPSVNTNQYTWSSTSQASDANRALVVHFGTGYGVYDTKSNNLACPFLVRGG